MASSTPQPAAEFYEWALKRYQRRAAVLTRVLVAITLIALLLAGLFVVEVRELNTQNISTGNEVERLRDQLVDLRSMSERKDKRTIAYVKCLESRTQRYEEGMTRLLRRKISIRVFLKSYKLKDCR